MTVVSSPKKLFLIDGVGALVSALFLGVLLVQFEPLFGIPKQTLRLLAVFPLGFSLFDFYCYFKRTNNYRPLLKTIAFCNGAYCIVSIGFMIHHRNQITALGWTYTIVEIAILLVLISIELKAARR